MKKKHCQKKHAIKRIKERYNLVLSSKDYKEIIKKVQSGQTKILLKQSLRVSLRSVEWTNNETLYFIYDNKRGTVVTFLTKEQVESHKQEIISYLSIKEEQENIKKKQTLTPVDSWDMFKRLCER